MTTYTELLEPTKSEKHGLFTWVAASDNFTRSAGTLTISGTRSHAVYAVEEFPADHGRGFVLLKKTPGTDTTEDHYSVFIGTDGIGACECKGFTRYSKCKHLQSLLELVKSQQI